MKVCPVCNQTYDDDSLNYCLNDGTVLTTPSGNQTAEMKQSVSPTFLNQSPTISGKSPYRSEQTLDISKQSSKSNSLIWVLLILGGLFFVCGGSFAGIYFWMQSNNPFSQNNDANSYTQNTNNGISNQKSDNRKTSIEPTDAKSLTMEKFLQIDKTTSYQKAVEILGSEGEQTSSTGSGSYKVEIYQWKGDDDDFIFLTFMNDKLTSKTQSGLSRGINESLTLQKFNQVKDGMKYEEVSAILGEGDLQSGMYIMGTAIETYQWKADDFSYVSINFQNGRVNSRTQIGLK